MNVPRSPGEHRARRRRIVRVTFDALASVAIMGWLLERAFTSNSLLFRVAAILAAVGLVLIMVGRFRVYQRFVRTGSWTDWGLMPELQGGTWTLYLDSPGSQEIHVIKVIREITGCGIRQAKHFTDNAPSALAFGLSEDGARRAASMLDAVGATTRVSQAPPKAS